MKIRIKGNTLRLRLTKPEVATLATDGNVEEHTPFPDGKDLIYRLQASPISMNNATFLENEIVVSVPHSWAQEWNMNEEVGVDFLVETNSDPLHILIEKDFNCITPRADENQDDHFTNPLTSHDKC